MKIDSDRSPTPFLIILKNHLIQFQKVNFFQGEHSKIDNKKESHFIN